MIDLDRLRATIFVSPATGDVATVTRNFLVEVEREIREGRAAQAQLAGERAFADVLANTLDGIDGVAS